MLKLKEQVFGEVGYSSDLMLSPEELNVFRQVVNAQWLSTISTAHPDLFEEATQLGIENYHLLSDRLNHQKLWPKKTRVLPQASVNLIKALPFIATLKKEFGDFTISDIYDTEQHYGEEEIYWRLVRPGVETDVGPLHKDKWFHGAFNSGYGMFEEGVQTVKIWIPIFCEPGKSGLRLAAGSHLREWKYHMVVTDGVPRPHPDEDLSDACAKLMHTEPGNLLLFNESVLHGGVLNNGNKTRVSAEITMVLKEPVTNFSKPQIFKKTVDEGIK